MRPLNRISAVAQVAAHLREELRRGTWSKCMPGVHALAEELGSNHGTVEAALRLMEKQRLLVPQGAGRARLIRIPRARKADRPLRIAILDYDPIGVTEGYAMEFLHLLHENGHKAFFTRKCLLDLQMDLRRVKRLVARTSADAWIVASASREVLEWFSDQPLPAFAWFGCFHELRIPAVMPDKIPAYLTAVQQLIELGHRRIVMLVHSERRIPQPEKTQQAVLDFLAARGLEAGSYNIPDWDESKTGFHACLKKLFETTPPTAMIIDDVPLVFSAMQFLTEHCIRVPGDVSLVSTHNSPLFSYSLPSVAHIHWDTRPVVRRILQWVSNVAQGCPDMRQTLTPAKFVPGGTIGPAPGLTAR